MKLIQIEERDREIAQFPICFFFEPTTQFNFHYHTISVFAQFYFIYFFFEYF